MTSDELRNYATVVAALVALLVFVVNSLMTRRNRRLENVARFIEAHDRLFERDEGHRAVPVADAGAAKEVLAVRLTRPGLDSGRHGSTL